MTRRRQRQTEPIPETVLYVVDWETRYEPAKRERAPEHKGLDYWKAPVYGHKPSNGWRDIVETVGTRRALAVLGVWDMVAQTAADAPKHLRGFVLTHRQQPAPLSYLAERWSVPVKQVADAVEVLVEIGWLTWQPADRVPVEGRSEPKPAGGGRSGTHADPKAVWRLAELMNVDERDPEFNSHHTQIVDTVDQIAAWCVLNERDFADQMEGFTTVLKRQMSHARRPWTVFHRLKLERFGKGSSSS